MTVENHIFENIIGELIRELNARSGECFPRETPKTRRKTMYNGSKDYPPLPDMR